MKGHEQSDLQLSPSHLHIFSSSHLPIYSPSHLPIFPHSPILPFSFSHIPALSLSHLLTFPSSHLPTFPSSHFSIFSSPHTLPFSLSHSHNPFFTKGSTSLKIFTVASSTVQSEVSITRFASSGASYGADTPVKSFIMPARAFL